MKNTIKFSLLSMIILLLQGCATHTNFVNKYNSWVGKDIQKLIAQIGYPDSTYVLPNKNKVYVYEKSEIYSFSSGPMFGYGYGGYYGGYGMLGFDSEIVQDTCKLFLETNRKGRILKWASRGNDCISDE